MLSSTGLFRGLHLDGGFWGDAVRVDAQSWLDNALAHVAGQRSWEHRAGGEPAETLESCGQSNFRPIGALLQDAGGEGFRAIVDRISSDIGDLFGGDAQTGAAHAREGFAAFARGFGAAAQGRDGEKSVDMHADPISPAQSEEPGGAAPTPLVAGAFATSPTVIETVDAAAGIGTTYQLQVGQTARGTIGTLGDRDWFAVNLQAGQTYSFAMTGTGVNNLTDPFLRLMDSTGLTQLQFNDDGLPGANSIFTYTPTTSGTYYVAAGAWEDLGTGQYGLTVAAGTKPSFDIFMGAGVIDADVAWTGTPGTGAVVTYAFRANPATYNVTGSDISTFTQLTATQMTAVRAALQAWSEVSGITFVEVNPGGYSDNAVMLFANYSDPNDGAGAFAFYPGSPLPGAAAGDVWLNTNSIPTGSAIAPGSYAYSAIMHEIGHAIGLSHPGLYNAGPGVVITYANNAQFVEDSDQYTLMSYFDEANTGAQFFGHPESPMLLDVLAAQNIYGANMTTRAGDTTYGFNSNAGGIYDFAANSTPAFTIWDAGGIDTLDASGYATNQTIDLNQGAFSTIGNLTANNIAIALGAVIENATGGSGNDTIRGNDAANVLIGNAGNDTLIGGAGADTLDGGAGSQDMAAYDTSSAAVSIDLQSGVNLGGDAAGDTLIGIEDLSGSAFDDSLFGDAAVNRLFGNGGTDFIQGRGGNDVLSGGDGDDWLDGGAGADVIDGGAGSNDVAAYGASTSAVNLDLQAGTYSGGDATGDVLSGIEGLSGSSFNDQLFGDGLANRLFGQGGNDFIQGRGGNDIISGGDGDDWLDGGAGADIIDGGAGFDIAAFGASAAAVNLDLGAFTYTGGDATGDVLSNIEGLSGSAFNDHLFGNATDNKLFGQGGNDFIQGRAGNDIISGGDGNDWLDGGAGADIIDGGAGFDIAAFGASAAAVNLDLGAFTYTGGDATGDVLSNIEGVSGSSFGDQIFGNNEVNALYGQGGNDFIQGRGGNDIIQGGDGDDWLDGGAGADTIDGGNGANDIAAYGASTSAVSLDLQSGVYTGGDAAGDVLSGIEGLSGSGFDDVIYGNALANRLFGQGGADTLAGRGGDDYLVGGAGDDVFVFTDNGGADQIADFDDFGDDVIQLAVAGVVSFNDVAAVMSQVGNDVLIDFATTDIVLLNTTLTSMQADDFMFV